MVVHFSCSTSGKVSMRWRNAIMSDLGRFWLFFFFGTDSLRHLSALSIYSPHANRFTEFPIIESMKWFVDSMFFSEHTSMFFCTSSTHERSLGNSLMGEIVSSISYCIVIRLRQLRFILSVSDSLQHSLRIGFVR